MAIHVTAINGWPSKSLLAQTPTLPTVQFAQDSYAVSSIDPSGPINVFIAIDLVNPPTNTITVDYATSDGSAVAGTHYATTSGTLSFAPGEVRKTFKVPVIFTSELGIRTVNLTLSNATNASLGAPFTATLNIVYGFDWRLQFSMIDYNVTEDVGTVAMNVLMNKPLPWDVKVKYRTANTNDSPAKPGEDFTLAPGTLIFPANSTAPQQINVRLRNRSTFRSPTTPTTNPPKRSSSSCMTPNWSIRESLITWELSPQPG